MKIEMTSNGNKIDKDFPTSWEETTFSQWRELQRCGNKTIKIISVLAGISEEVLRKAKIHNLSLILYLVKYVKIPIKELSPPKTILGYEVPKDLERESIAQYADIQDILSKFKDGEDNFDHYPLLVATYCVKPYDYEKAEALAPEFLNAPCTEVMAVADFTFTKWLELSRPKSPTSPPVATPKSKSRRATRS